MRPSDGDVYLSIDRLLQAAPFLVNREMAPNVSSPHKVVYPKYHHSPNPPRLSIAA